MSRDTERRIHSEVEAVLNEFGIPFESAQRSKHPAVEFTVNGKRTVYAYGGGDPRAHMNARSDLRRILIGAGARPVPAPEPIRKELLNGTVMSPTITEEVIKDVQLLEAVMPDRPVVPPITTTAPDPETEPVFLNPERPYLVYTPKQLVPGQVIVIELEHDIMAEKGSVIIVPLHKPNAIMSMSKLQFEATFMMMEQPIVETEPVLQPEPEPVPAPVVKPKAESKKTNPPSVETYRKVDPPWVEKVPEGVSGLKPKRHYRTSAVDGVGPQLGRVLVSMAYMSDKLHKVDLVPSMFNDILDPTDRRQYAARMITAIKLGYAERGLPLTEGRGWHNKLTQEGFKIARKLGKWPWTHDGLQPPAWVK